MIIKRILLTEDDMQSIEERLRFQIINLKNACKEYKEHIKFNKNFGHCMSDACKERQSEQAKCIMERITYFVKRIKKIKEEQ